MLEELRRWHERLSAESLAADGKQKELRDRLEDARRDYDTAKMHADYLGRTLEEVCSLLAHYEARAQQ